MNRSIPLTLCLTLSLFAAGCAHRVDPRPNDCVRTSGRQTLVVANETAKPLTLLPPADAPQVAPLTIAPGSQTALPFELCDSRNRSPGQEHEIVLMQGSAPYLTLSDLDFKLQAKFGGGAAKEIRVTPGDCLFQPEQAGKAHVLHVKRPPLAGVPALRLCP